MSIKTLNIGMIGMGRWGTILSQEFAKRANIIKYYSRHEKDNNLRIIPGKPPLYVPDYNDILSDPAIDAVVIATPIKTHFQITKSALLNKKHVFVEKPISQSSADIKEIIKTAKDNNLNCQVDYIYTFHPVLNKLMGLTKQNKIMRIETEWKKYGTFSENIFLNLAVHELSIAITLFGEAKKITNVKRYSPDRIVINILHTNNSTSEISIDRSFKGDPFKRVRVYTEDGLFCEWENNRLNWIDSNGREQIFASKEMPLGISCDNFIKQIQDGRYDYKTLLLDKKICEVLQMIPTTFLV